VQQRAFSLAAVPPYRLDLTVWALRRREDNAIDSWDGRTYRRVLDLGSGPIELVAVQEAAAVPQLAVQLTGVQLTGETEGAAQAALRRLLGLETDLSAFYSLAADDPFLGPLTRRFRGLKPPRLPTLFECLVNAIACQQLTLTVGIRLGFLRSRSDHSGSAVRRR
jgi:DNA-3-methyladenine glycosylase II